jgi:hypothetical protein
MKIRVGFEMHYEFPQPTLMIMVLGTHFTRASDIIVTDYLTTSPSVPISPYRDMFGNWCSRIVALAGHLQLSADGVIRDNGLPDPGVSRGRPARDRGPSGGYAGLPTRRPLLRDRHAFGSCMEAVRDYAPRFGACRPSAISCIATLPSDMSMPAPL